MSAVVAPPAPADAPVEGAIEIDTYRPHIDGLRAVAVYLVVLFHAGWARFSGGFVGVDVFFVLSGYLVTQLLVRDLDARGSIGFGRFYSRRFRRLLPAAFVTLIVTAAVFTSIASPLEVSDAVGAFQAAFLYVTNWYFIHQASDYFAAGGAASPVLHFWSLAVEEQFYLLWPLLLGGVSAVARRTRRPRTVLRVVVLVGGIASLVWAWHLKGVDPARAYYGTDTRAYQLLAGALLALVLVPRGNALRALARARASVIAVLVLAALVLVSTSWLDVDAIVRGTIVTAITVVTIASLESSPHGRAAWLLSRRTVVYLGKISYGTYLWHWPVILVISRTFEITTTSTILLTVLVATGLASLSFQLMEHPIRASRWLDRHRLPVIAAGLTISAISALVLIPAITETEPADSARAATAEVTGLTPVPTGIDFASPQLGAAAPANCVDEPPSQCTLVDGDGKHILLIGDSHGAMMLPAIRKIAEERGLKLSMATKGGCPWQRDLYGPELEVSGQPLRVEDCQHFKDDLYDRVIPALDPDVIVAMNLGYELPGHPLQYLDDAGKPMSAQDPRFKGLLRERTTASAKQLTSGGTDLVILEPIPWAVKANPTQCLSKAKFVEECRFVSSSNPTPLESIYRDLADADDHVWTFDIDRLACPFLPICDPIVNGRIVRSDSSHLNRAYEHAIAPDLATLFDDNGLLPRAP